MIVKGGLALTLPAGTQYLLKGADSGFAVCDHLMFACTLVDLFEACVDSTGDYLC